MGPDSTISLALDRREWTVKRRLYLYSAHRATRRSTLVRIRTCKLMPASRTTQENQTSRTCTYTRGARALLKPATPHDPTFSTNRFARALGPCCSCIGAGRGAGIDLIECDASVVIGHQGRAIMLLYVVITSYVVREGGGSQ
jgi:hypothetical protein